MSTTSRSLTIAPVQEIRSYFPALERVHNGEQVAYFDGPGGTQVPRQVVDRMSDYLYHHNANTHWAYPTSEETDAAIEDARQVCGDFLNGSPAEIAFGANMTTLTFHLGRALAPRFNAGDEIIVTELDHHANVDTWRQLGVERNLNIRTVKMNTESGELDWANFEALVTAKTKLIAIGAASNALGTINDLRRAISLARSVGAFAFVDAVHYVPHVLADVRALDCDFLAMSSYKFYGPHVGVLYGKQDLLADIQFPKLIPAPDYTPENAETGTQNQEGMVGTAAAIDFLASLGGNGSRRESLIEVYEELHQRNAGLIKLLWEGLSEMPRVRLYGPTPGTSNRTPTLSFTIDGVASTEVARLLAGKGLFLSHGDFYAYTVVERLELAPEGLVRAGCACYTTEDEIQRLITGVADIITKSA